MADYYIPSGRWSPLRALGGFLFSLIPLAGVGFPYAYGNMHFDHVLFRGLMPFALGGAVGLMGAYTLVWFGHIRSKGAGMAVGALLGASAILLAWPPYLWMAADAIHSEDLARLYNPVDLFRVFQDLLPEVGWLYLGFWTLEFAVAAALTGLICVMAVANNPYCETCQKWPATMLRVRVLATDQPEMVRAALEEGHFEVLDLLPALSPADAADDKLVVRLDLCHSCRDAAYITVERLVKTVNPQGKPQNVTLPVVKFLRAPWAAAERLAPAEKTISPPDAALGGDSLK